MENLQPLNNTMLVSSLIAFALIIDVSFATTPMDYGAAVNILGPTVDEMASSVRGRDPVAPLRTTSIAALAYEQSVILPLLQDCQATMKADRGGLGEFLKSQSKLDDRVFQERLSELVRLQHDAKLSESLESILKKDYEASEKAERDIANTMQNFKGLSNERAGVVQKTGDDVGNAAKTALNNGTKLTYRQRKYLRESSTLQSEAKVAGGSQDEVDDIKNLVKDGAKGTSRWVRETEKKSSRKFSVVARKHAEKLKKYISLRSVVSSGITETNAAKLEWDNTLDAICRPFLIDILSTRQVVASTRAMLRSFEEEEESNDEEDNEIILGHDLGRARLHCENCDEEEEEEEEEKVVEVVEEIEEIPEFPEPCYYCVKRGDSVFSIASKFKVEPLALHLTSDWDFSTKAQQFVSSSKILFDSNEENRYLPVNTSLKVHLPPHVVEVASIEKFGDDSEEQDSKIFGYVAVTDVDRHTIRVAVQVEGFKNKIRVAVHSGKSCESHNHLDSHFYDLSKIPMINQSSSSNETALKRKPLVMRARIHPTYKKYFDMIIHDGKLPNEVYGIMDPSLDKSLIRTPNRLVPVELAPSSIGEDGDPWKIPEAKFEIDSEGKVHGIFDLSCGLSATQLENRAVAIEQVDKHGQWHMKACGTLRARKGGFSWNGFQDDGSYRHNEMCTSPEMMMHCKPEKIPVHGRQILDMLKPLKEYEACVEDSSFRENLGQKAFASVADAESISVEGWVYMSQSGGELARISAERRERLEQSDEGLHAEETVEQRARRLDREAVVGALVAGTLHSSDVNPATGVRDGSGPYQRGWALSVEATPKPVKQASMMATEGPEGQCVDSLNWKDAAGSDCADYEEFMWCSARQPSCMEKGVGCHEEMLSGFEAQMKMLKRYHDLRLAMQAAQRNAKYYVNHDANMMRRDGINDTEIILQNEAEAKARYDNISREVTATFDQEDKDYVTIGGVGPGWVSEWGEFSDWMSRPFQSSASQACCACGAIKTLRAVREARNAAANVYGGQGVAPLPPKEPRQAVSVVWRYKGSSGNDGHIGELRYSIPLEHQWIHVAGTYNATTGQSVLYVNGNKVATDTSSQIGSILYARGEQPNVTFMSPLNNDTAVNSTCAKGEIQDVNIWRTALSHNEILSHFNKGRGSRDSGTNCKIEFYEPDEAKTISVIPPNRPKLPAPNEDADEKVKARWKKMRELADRADKRDAIRSKFVCNSLVFRYPFNNRLHRDLHVDDPSSLLDILPDQWYVSRPRPLSPLWGKSGPERLVEGASIRGERQIQSNEKHLELAKTNLDKAHDLLAEANKNLTNVRDKIKDAYVSLKEVTLTAKQLDAKAGEKMDQIKEQQRALKKMKENVDLSEEDEILFAQRSDMLQKLKSELRTTMQALDAANELKSKSYNRYHNLRHALKKAIQAVEDSDMNLKASGAFVGKLKIRSQMDIASEGHPEKEGTWEDAPWTQENLPWDPRVRRQLTSSDIKTELSK